MMSARAAKPVTIPPYTRGVQNRASSPEHSAWVEANAGAGKTHVLTSRVIRLMLSGTLPDTILCLTFTEAAATSMANRIFDRLANWIRLDSNELRDELSALLGRAPLAHEFINARQLFARALESPGGLKIQTIHAFAERLLHQFPLEAGVWPDFSVLDSSEALALREGARLSVFSAHDQTGLSALKQLQRYLTISQIDNLLHNCLKEEQAFLNMIRAHGGRSQAEAALGRYLNSDHLMGIEESEADMLNSSLIAPSMWLDVAEKLREGGGKRAVSFAEKWEQAYAAIGAPWALETYLGIFMGKGGFYSESYFLSKGFREAYPQITALILSERERLEGLVHQREERKRFEISRALYQLIGSLSHAYRREKALLHKLDFNDLITYAGRLLSDEGASWVHYKLDRGINHILVDEAQDTSPDQWLIIDLLAAEFYSGDGARPSGRTFFAVGDKKQSIYRFQGVDPGLFEKKSRAYYQSFSRAGMSFQRDPLILSFRSLPKVMDLVMTVFASGKPAQALGQDGLPAHESLPHRKGGQVSLWPLEFYDKSRPETDPWLGADAAGDETASEVRLAKRIARYLKRRFQAADLLPSGARLKPGDCLILVRERKALFWALIQALKQEGLPFAGADRLVLVDHLAIKDLLALATALITPYDDLTLAAVLKSPLFGLSEDELFTLAWQRQGVRLIKALRNRAEAAEEPYLSHYQRFLDWQRCARTLSPFAFFQYVLGAGGGFKALYGRLGYEAEEALQVFLDQAKEAELKGINALRLFVYQCQHDQFEVKRQAESGRNEVRIMTIHNAKGLEAPLVILADTTRKPTARFIPKWLDIGQEGKPLFVWSSGKDDPHEEIRAGIETFLEEDRHEYYRQLYVALTRAAEEIIIAGALGRQSQKADEESWYGLCQARLQDDLVVHESFGEEVGVWRYEEKEAARSDDTESQGESEEALPEWLFCPPPAAPAPLPLLFPSRLWPMDVSEDYSGSDFLVDEQDDKDRAEKARRRGISLHRILERWCPLPEEEKQAALPRLIALNSWDGGAKEDDEFGLQSVIEALWQDRVLSWIFSSEGLCEVPVVGTLGSSDKAGRLSRVSGTIDRLLVHEGAFWLIDYKTGRWTPSPHYRRQLALYGRLIEETGQTLPVKTALLWIDEARFEEVFQDEREAILEKEGLK